MFEVHQNTISPQISKTREVRSAFINLLIEAEYEEDIEDFIKKYADITVPGNKELLTIFLYEAVKRAEKEIVELLLTMEIDIDSPVGEEDENGYTALFAAAWKGRKDVVELLIGYDAAFDLSMGDGPSKGCTPLFIAAAYGRIDVVELLINRGANFKSPMGDGPAKGMTPLVIAAMNGRKDVVELLIDRGADFVSPIGDGPPKGMTPLYITAGGGHKEVAELLIERGADVASAMGDGKADGVTPLFMAAGLGYIGVVEILLAKGANFDSPLRGGPLIGKTPLYAAVKKGYHNVVDLLLSAHKEAHKITAIDLNIYADLPEEQLEWFHNYLCSYLIEALKDGADIIGIKKFEGLKSYNPVFANTLALYHCLEKNEFAKFLVLFDSEAPPILTFTIQGTGTIMHALVKKYAESKSAVERDAIKNILKKLTAMPFYQCDDSDMSFTAIQLAETLKCEDLLELLKTNIQKLLDAIFSVNLNLKILLSNPFSIEDFKVFHQISGEAIFLKGESIFNLLIKELEILCSLVNQKHFDPKTEKLFSEIEEGIEIRKSRALIGFQPYPLNKTDSENLKNMVLNLAILNHHLFAQLRQSVDDTFKSFPRTYLTVDESFLVELRKEGLVIEKVKTVPAAPNELRSSASTLFWDAAKKQDKDRNAENSLPAQMPSADAPGFKASGR